MMVPSRSFRRTNNETLAWKTGFDARWMALGFFKWNPRSESHQRSHTIYL